MMVKINYELILHKIMKLHFKKTGEGKPLIVLHGLFGSGDNWMSFSRMMAEENFAVYQVDLRNHGHSPHSLLHNYKVMSEDVLELIQTADLDKPVVLGHSMGGKVAMQLAIDHTDSLSSIIVVDITTQYYPVHHGTIIQALLSVDVNKIQSRKEAEEQLAVYINDAANIQFLMKGLYRKDEHFAWRFNLPVLSEQIENVGEEIKSEKPVDIPVLFIRGERSNYIDPGKFDECKNIFPDAKLVTISNAGHWVHADQPLKMMEEVMDFLDK